MHEFGQDPALSRGAASGSEPYLSDHVAVVKNLEALRYWRTREEAARGLVKYGRVAVPGLLDALYEQNVGVRLQAVAALAAIGDQGAVEGLAGALWDEHPLVRQHAADALGQLGSARALEDLFRVLDDEDVWVRQHAAAALGHIGANHPEKARQIVFALLDRSIDASVVRRAAVGALVRIGVAAVPALREALHAARWTTRRAAADALAKIGQDAVPALRDTLNSSPHSGAQRMAAWALDRIS